MRICKFFLQVAIAGLCCCTACTSPNYVKRPANIAPPPQAQWVETDRGLRYAVSVAPKPGARQAQSGDTVTVHYVGAFPDGAKFDSSRDRQVPFTFSLGRHQVITGWEQCITGMRVGEKRYVIIPPELAYGENGAGPIPAHTDLHYEIELLNVEATKPLDVP